MRVAWVTPDYPPDRGGVSDHSSAMVGALREAGHDVLVGEKPHEHGFDELSRKLTAFAPELVVVAYTPLGYAPRTGGLAPAFTRWCVGLAIARRGSTVLLAHEASLPAVDLLRDRRYKLAVLGVAQAAQFSLLAACFDTVFFSTMATKQLWADGLPLLAKRFHTLRICSNIPYLPSRDPRAELGAAGQPVPSKTILFFGTGHESVLFDYVEAAFLALLQVEPRAVLVVIGMTLDKLRERRPSLAALGERIRVLGYVEAEHLSRWLQVAELVLAPLVEGVSARKGTVMAALQHGQTVVTTRGFHTRSDIDWERICLLAPLDRDAFAAQAVAALRSSDLRTTIGRAAREEYEAHASVPVTASRILQSASLRTNA